MGITKGAWVRIEHRDGKGGQRVTEGEYVGRGLWQYPTEEGATIEFEVLLDADRHHQLIPLELILAIG